MTDASSVPGRPAPESGGRHPMSTAAPILQRALLYDAVLAVGIAVVGGAVGWLVAGMPGLVSALLAAGLTVVYFGLTAATILLAVRVSRGALFSTVFFGIVLGGWLVKLLVFLVLVVVLSRASFIEPYVFFVTIVVGVIGSLTADVIAFQRSRVPYVSDVELPGEDEGRRRR
jgi:hypothetical protein